ncbi:MAG: hypothetical protein MUE53_03440 [Chitinophagales bacterium]|nr:hypothetical protein [Chitinophagales bacterium]
MKYFILFLIIAVHNVTYSQESKYYAITKYNQNRMQFVFYHNFDIRNDSISYDDLYKIDEKKWINAICQNINEDSCSSTFFLLMKSNLLNDSIENVILSKNWEKSSELIYKIRERRISDELNRKIQNESQAKFNEQLKYYTKDILDWIEKKDLNVSEYENALNFNRRINNNENIRLLFDNIVKREKDSFISDFIYRNAKYNQDINNKKLQSILYKEIVKNNRYTEEDFNLIIQYNLFSLKDSLYPIYEKTEKEINEDPYNFENIERDIRIPSIKPVHIALAKYGDKRIEELIYQRIDHSKYTRSVRNGIQIMYFDIDTKKSLQRAIAIAKKQRKEYKNEVEEYEHDKHKGGWCGARSEYSIKTFLKKCNEKKEKYNIIPRDWKFDNGDFVNLNENLKTIDYYIETIQKYTESLK